MKSKGYLHLVCGPMYSGKSSELIRLTRRELIAERKVQAFKYGEDNRYSKNDIASHDKLFIPAEPITSISEIEKKILKETNTIVIDETQFFNSEIIDFGVYLRDEGMKAIFAGLDLDFRGEPFPFHDSDRHMGELMAKANLSERLSSICTYALNGTNCGETAERTQRNIDGKPAPYNSPIKLIGATDNYEARCIGHHFVPGKPIFKS